MEGGDEFGSRSLSSGGGSESLVSDPLSSLGILLDKSWGFLESLSGWLGVTLGLNSVWVGNDGSVNLFVKILAGLDLGGGEGLGPVGELSLEFLGIVLLEGLHVFSNVGTEDSCSVCLGIEFSGNSLFTGRFTSLVFDLSDSSSGVTWESLSLMWYVKSTIACSLKNTEDSGTSGGSLETNIEKSLEWSLVIITVIINVKVFSVDISGGFVKIVKTDLFQQSSGEEKTGGISGSVVGKTSGKTVSLKLGRIGSAQNSISSHGGEDNLGDEFGVSSSNDKSVFLRVILVLVLLN